MTLKDLADGAVRYWVLVLAGVGLIAAAAVAGERIVTLSESVRAQQTQAEEIQRIQIEQTAIRKDVERSLETAKQNQAILIELLQRTGDR